MAKKRTKSVSFDAMVKFFMQHYNIPTRSDIDRLVERLDRMEKLMQAASLSVKARRAPKGKGPPAKPKDMNSGPATDNVLKVIQSAKGGAGVAEIEAATGFDTKKIRNVLYRLHKTGKIQRIDRGRYEAV